MKEDRLRPAERRSLRAVDVERLLQIEQPDLESVFLKLTGRSLRDE